MGNEKIPAPVAAESPAPQSPLKACVRSEVPTENVLRAPLWRRCFYRFITALYFQRVTLLHPERLPTSGPVLYLGLHRNGAVDGFVYDRVLRAPVFMISAQLRKNPLARLFFDGIAVTRAKDEGDHALNDAALRQCLAQLRAGGELFVFPEGTSSLGPRHLPFKSGAVWLLLDYLEQFEENCSQTKWCPLSPTTTSPRPSPPLRGGEGGGIASPEHVNTPLHVVPLGIHYECPWSFRSKVEVVVGTPVSTELPSNASRLEKLKAMKGRVQTALEEVGINVPTAEYQEMIQAFAYVSTLGTPHSWFKSLKAMEHAIHENILTQWRAFEPEIRESKLWFHQGVPLVPVGPLPLYLLALLITGILTLAAVAANLPPFVAGWLAGKKFSDDRNVISLWKILVGVPVLILWLAGVTVALLLIGKWWWLVVYAAITWLGLKCYYRFKKLAVAVHNALRRPALRPKLLAFHTTVLESLPDETF